MTRWGVYIDRPGLVEKTAEALQDTGIPWQAWLMCETSRGKLTVKDRHSLSDLYHGWTRSNTLEGWDLDPVVWPRDGGDHPARYAHLFDPPDHAHGFRLRADVEGQDRDGHIEHAEIYTGGVTSYPFHKIIKDWQHPAGEEVQVYPTRGSDLEVREEDAIDWALDLTGATAVALPLYKLPKSNGAVGFGSERAFLRAMVERCLGLGVEEINFWSAKHLFNESNDYALPFLTEDLPEIVAEHEARNRPEPDARTPDLRRLVAVPDLEKRVAELEGRVRKLESR